MGVDEQFEVDEDVPLHDVWDVQRNSKTDQQTDGQADRKPIHLSSLKHRQTARQPYRGTDGQTDRQTGTKSVIARETDRQTGGEIDG